MTVHLAHGSKTDRSVSELLGRYRRELVAYLEEALSRSRDSPLFEMMRYHLGLEGQDSEGALGKALRPTLALFACEALGGEWRRALPAAGALELVHNFSLVHDDIQDQDRRRRHRPTVWTLWGVGQAINVGDALHALATLTLPELTERGYGEAITARAQGLLSRATLTMIEGQALDLSFEGRFDLTVADYLEMIAKKTGALMACALELGGLLGGGTDGTTQALSESGRHLGLAFQIRDDLLGIWGAQERTGKPSSDIRRKKRTLPVVYALEHPESRGRLRAVFERGNLSEADGAEVRALLEGVGADRKTQRLATEYAGRARRALDGVPLPRWAWEIFCGLIAFSSLEREG